MAGVGGDKIVDPVELALREPSRRRDRASSRTPSAKRAPQNHGADLVALTATCGMCQCPMPGDARFCPSCGTRTEGPPSLNDVPATPAPSPRPVPYDQLSPDQKRERDLAHARAVAAGKHDPGVAGYLEAPPQAKSVLIHVLRDGFTAFGQVWYIGQEMEVEIGGPRWEEAQRWILMDDFQQMIVYGRINFRHGPWPGVRSYTAAAGRFTQLTTMDGEHAVASPPVEALAQADAMEQRRGRRVPAPSFA